MDEQTRIDILTMQLLFAKFADKIAGKGFTQDADDFMATCDRLKNLVERNFSE